MASVTKTQKITEANKAAQNDNDIVKTLSHERVENHLKLDINNDCVSTSNWLFYVKLWSFVFFIVVVGVVLSKYGFKQKDVKVNSSSLYTPKYKN